MNPTSVLATITGRDRPGVTAALFAALAAHDVDVRGVEQVVIRERLVIAVLLDLRGDPTALRNSVSQTAHALGMECELAVADDPRATERQYSSRSHVIVLGHPLRAGALSHLAQRIAERGDNIEAVTQLSREPLSSIELIVSSDDPDDLRSVLVQAAEESGIDLAVEPALLRRRAKRLIMLDLDATLIRGGAIDLLAERVGTGGRTGAPRRAGGARSPAGGLRERAALLAGLSLQQVEAVRDRLELTAGAPEFVRRLHRFGFRVGVVSSGFTIVTDRFVDELELDFAAANELELDDGRLTGRLRGAVVDGAGKADALRRFAADYAVPLSQTVAVGDSAEDLDLLCSAGLGIAFNAGRARRVETPASRPPNLDTVLFVLGLLHSDARGADEG